MPNDVYLTYSIFILSSAMRITALPLILNSAIPALGPDLSASVPRPIEGPPAYVSLLTEPFVAPKVLDTKNLSKEISPSAPPPYTTNGEFTPAMLRYIGQAVDQFKNKIREVELAARAVDMRCTLQKDEFARQQAKALEALARIEKLKGERQDETRSKLEKVRENQRALMTRVDRILGVMMRNASPEVSEHERRWFEELKRMKEEVVGRGRYDEESLLLRTSLVSFTCFVSM